MALLGPEGSQLVGRWVIAETLNAIFSRYFIPQEQWIQPISSSMSFKIMLTEENPELLRRLA